MQTRLILSVLCGIVGSAGPVLAAPIYVTKSDAVAEPRRDSGTGICGSMVKFVNQPSPVGTVEEATLLLDRVKDDPNIVGRVSRLVQNVNMTIGPGSEADFREPMYPDEYFPYCNHPQSMPMGNNDYNIAVRIRGYINVPQATQQPVTIALNCDDGCAMRIGASRQLVSIVDERSPVLTGRRARSVVFQDAGLYPVEIVYYQNATSGYLEASRASTTPFSGDDVSVSNTAWSQQASNFKPLGGVELFSAITGASSDCQECSAADSACAAGSYCGDGLCQACNQPDHCGSSCAACPTDKHVCSAGKCVQCTSDGMCAGSGRCDLGTGMCQPPAPCTASSECKQGDVCRPEGFCGTPPKPCSDASVCDGSERCLCEDLAAECSQKVCRQPPIACMSDSQCPAEYGCDTEAQSCKITYRLYGGGLSACDVSRGVRSSSNGLGLLALLGFSLLTLRARVRRARASA